MCYINRVHRVHYIRKFNRTTNTKETAATEQFHLYIKDISLTIQTFCPTQQFETFSHRSIFPAPADSVCSILSHNACTHNHRKEKSIYFILSLSRFIWPDYAFSCEIFRKTYSCYAREIMNFSSASNVLKIVISEISNSRSRQKCTATLLQAMTIRLISPMPRRYGHWQYHAREHCHTGAIIESITQ